LVVTAARLIAEQKVVGWFQGRMEFGPRALGNRSILGDPRNPLMQSTMNLKIKFRESFRPFACAILHDQAHKVYKIRAEHESPYMLVVADLHDELRTGPALDFTRRNRFEQLDVSRSVYSSVTHVDYSSRLQSVDPHRNPLFHQLLSEFYLLTGCPLLINTSFNVRGEPIVCSPEDAWRCFNNTDMDALIIGQCVLLKTEQSVRRQLENRTDYLANYPLD
jgi:carbamoyltransferase